MQHNNILPVVLAGGKSQRFGKDKTQAKLGDKILIDYILSEIINDFKEIVIVTNDPIGHLKSEKIIKIKDSKKDLGPLGGVVYFCFVSNMWRKDAIRMYGLVEEKTSCCLPESCWFGCHYPCSLFQVYNTLKILKEEGYPSVKNPGPAIGKVVSSEKRTYRVALPLGSVPGTFVAVSLPDGRQVTVQVPPQVYVTNDGASLTEIDIVA